MSGICAHCAWPTPEVVLWIDREGIPPGEPGHNITYGHALVAICPACGHGQIETLAHDCFDFEDVWDQYEWFVLSPEDVARLAAYVAPCPRPLDPECSCARHLALRAAIMRRPATTWCTSLEAQEHVHPVTWADLGVER